MVCVCVYVMAHLLHVMVITCHAHLQPPHHCNPHHHHHQQYLLLSPDCAVADPTDVVCTNTGSCMLMLTNYTLDRR